VRVAAATDVIAVSLQIRRPARFHSVQATGAALGGPQPRNKKPAHTSRPSRTMTKHPVRPRRLGRARDSRPGPPRPRRTLNMPALSCDFASRQERSRHARGICGPLFPASSPPNLPRPRMCGQQRSCALCARGVCLCRITCMQWLRSTEGRWDCVGLRTGQQRGRGAASRPE